MNCRAGDIAEIIRSNAGNVGRRVAVLRLHDGNTNAYGPAIGPCWHVQPLQPLRCMAVLVVLANGAQVLLPAPDVNGACVFPDAWLRPIRDIDGAIDQMVERVGAAPPVERAVEVERLLEEAPKQ